MMDIQELRKHVVVVRPDMSDPIGSVGLGKYIRFFYTNRSLHGDEVAPEIYDLCLNTAQKIMDAEDDTPCKDCYGKKFMALEAKRDLLALIN